MVNLKKNWILEIQGTNSGIKCKTKIWKEFNDKLTKFNRYILKKNYLVVHSSAGQASFRAFSTFKWMIPMEVRKCTLDVTSLKSGSRTAIKPAS